MKESNTSAQERADTTDAPTAKRDSKNRIANTNEPDEQNKNNGGLARRQFLGAAAVAVGVTVPSGNAGGDESESLKGTVEWEAAGVWEDHLIPARQAFTSPEGVDIEGTKEELREGLQKLEALEVDDE